MQNAALFIITVLIWGTSWIAIAWQIGPVPVGVSVFYRFVLAAVLLMAVLALTGKLKRPVLWRYVALQGLCLFSLNFVALYNATALISSGLVAVVFSLASIFNAVNGRVFFGDRIAPRFVFAGAFGCVGLTLLFWEDLAISLDWDTVYGVGWAGLGTLIFSLGNMASRANGAIGVPTVIANGWGMAIGALVLLLLIVLTGQPLIIPTEPQYLLALIYLAVFASVVGFTTYLLLVERIGSAQAGYATVVFPVVALAVSTVLEDYQWTPTALAGVLLTMIGNIIMFARRRTQSTPA